jgi:hypothetical protein
MWKLETFCPALRSHGWFESLGATNTTISTSQSRLKLKQTVCWFWDRHRMKMHKSVIMSVPGSDDTLRCVTKMKVSDASMQLREVRSLNEILQTRNNPVQQNCLLGTDFSISTASLTTDIHPCYWLKVYIKFSLKLSLYIHKVRSHYWWYIQLCLCYDAYDS